MHIVFKNMKWRYVLELINVVRKSVACTFEHAAFRSVVLKKDRMLFRNESVQNELVAKLIYRYEQLLHCNVPETDWVTYERGSLQKIDMRQFDWAIKFDRSDAQDDVSIAYREKGKDNEVWLFFHVLDYKKVKLLFALGAFMTYPVQCPLVQVTRSYQRGMPTVALSTSPDLPDTQQDLASFIIMLLSLIHESSIGKYEGLIPLHPQPVHPIQ